MKTDRLIKMQRESLRRNIHCSECAVKECSILKNCSAECIDVISSSKQVYHFVPGQRILLEGSIAKGIYFVESGKIKIYKSDQKGQELILRFARPGQIIGYNSRNDSEENLVTVMAMTQATLCFLERDIFLQLARRFPDFAFDLLQYYSHELQQAEIKSMKLATMKVPEKVADALLTMYDAYGAEGKERTLKLELSRQDIANLAGTTKEQVSKVISELKERGIIGSKGKQINLLDLDALREIVKV